MTNFVQFRDAVNVRFNALSAGSNLFQSSVTKDDIWDTYLGSFPEGSNPTFRERTEHDCVCCKQFIRNVGRALFIKDGQILSIWSELPVTGAFKVVADTLAELNIASGISGIYLNDAPQVGRRESFETREDGSVHQWDHFHVILPQKAYKLGGGIGEAKGKVQTNCKVLKRSIVEIDKEVVEIVDDLISQNSLHRGNEYAPVIKGLIRLQREYEESANKEVYLWEKTVEYTTAGHNCNIRGTAIGTLLVDLSEGEELEVAVKKYEDKVSGTNYKRTTALVTPRMVNEAREKAAELGIEPSLPRRFAVKSDISANDTLFADSSVKPFMMDSVFDSVATKKPTIKANFDKVEEMSAEDFIKNVLPTATGLEVFVENKHEKNLVSLIAPINDDAPCIMKWDNNFSWSYNGEVAESDLRARVSELGGRVDGVLRFTHSWNHTGQNQSLMDLHVFFPTHKHNLNVSIKGGKEVHDYYGNDERVGWNNRKHSRTKGNQDVDFTAAPGNKIPVENITFPEMGLLPEGEYTFKIHNWAARKPNNTGFQAEIELNGEVFQYFRQESLENKEWITVATAVLKNGVFTVNHKMKPSNVAKDVWGITTGQFCKVDMVMRSPNMWDASNKSGNDHLFFMLDGCKNPDDARGFYNEFLVNELLPHRKVFEHLSASLKAPHQDEQLSGLGFSSTLRNDVVVKVSGSFQRMVKIKF